MTLQRNSFHGPRSHKEYQLFFKCKKIWSWFLLFFAPFHCLIKFYCCHDYKHNIFIKILLFIAVTFLFWFWFDTKANFERLTKFSLKVNDSALFSCHASILFQLQTDSQTDNDPAKKQKSKISKPYMFYPSCSSRHSLEL